MAGVVPVLILLDEASIYTLLDLAFDLVDLVPSGGVWTPPHYRPFKLWFEFEVHLDQFFTRQGWGQRSKNLLILVGDLRVTGVEIHALHVLGKSSSARRLLFPLSCFFIRPTVSGGNSSSGSWRSWA